MTNQGSIIGAGTQLQGILTGDEDLQVQGRVQGSITLTGSLVVDVDAVVEADVQARQVLVRGTVRGQITAGEMVHITGAGSVVGDIAASRIAIDEGVRYSGRLEMGQVPIPGGPLQPPEAEEVRRTRMPPPPVEQAAATAASGTRRRKKAARKPAKKARATRPPKPPTAAGRKARTRKK
jgi:cytoskeletal protein CcmA (bactofilin family)